MKLPDPMWLGLLYAASELWLGITHRSRESAVSQDKKSLRVLWIVILASVFFGIQVASWFPSAAMPHRSALRIIGFFIFVFGLCPALLPQPGISEDFSPLMSPFTPAIVLSNPAPTDSSVILPTPARCSRFSGSAFPSETGGPSPSSLCRRSLLFSSALKWRSARWLKR